MVPKSIGEVLVWAERAHRLFSQMEGVTGIMKVGIFKQIYANNLFRR